MAAETGEPRLVSKSEYARHRKVSPAMVTKWKGAGRIALVGKLVDVEKSDGMLAASMSVTRGGAVSRPDRAATGSRAGGRGAAPIETPLSRTSIAEKEASTDLKQVSTSLKRLTLERQAGRLVNREQFERTTEEIFTQVRDSMLGIPVKLCDLLAAESDPRRCMELMRTAITSALNERADMEEALAEQAMSTRQ